MPLSWAWAWDLGWQRWSPEGRAREATFFIMALALGLCFSILGHYAFVLGLDLGPGLAKVCSLKSSFEICGFLKALVLVLATIQISLDIDGLGAESDLYLSSTCGKDKA